MKPGWRLSSSSVVVAKKIWQNTPQREKARNQVFLPLDQKKGGENMKNFSGTPKKFSWRIITKPKVSGSVCRQEQCSCGGGGNGRCGSAK